ncbi:MAG: tetratricopeptide repeat protein [Bacteroidia bacterium]
MKYKLLLAILLFVLSGHSFAQNNSSNVKPPKIEEELKLKIEFLEKEVESFKETKKNILQLNNELEIKYRILENKIEGLNSTNQEKNDIAGKIIDWSAWLFSLMVLILGIAGWVAADRFSKIDLIRKELKELLGKTKTELDKQINEIEHLKAEFEREKEIAIDLMFPILEAQWFNYQGDFDKSISAYKRAQKIKPDYKLISYKLNKLLIEKGIFKEAIKNLEVLIEKYPDDIQLNRRLAEGYRRIGDFDSAEIVINKVLSKVDYPSVHYELGCIKLFSAKYKEAEESFKKANRFFFSEDGMYRYWVYVNLAIVQKLMGNQEESRLNSNKAIEILEPRTKSTPKNPHIWSYLALAYLSEKDNYKKSLHAFEQAIQYNLPISLATSALDRVSLLVDHIENKIEKKSIHEIKDFLKKYVS